jgi:hypothetical protein
VAVQGGVEGDNALLLTLNPSHHCAGRRRPGLLGAVEKCHPGRSQPLLRRRRWQGTAMCNGGRTWRPAFGPEACEPEHGGAGHGRSNAGPGGSCSNCGGSSRCCGPPADSGAGVPLTSSLGTCIGVQEAATTIQGLVASCIAADTFHLASWTLSKESWFHLGPHPHPQSTLRRVRELSGHHIEPPSFLEPGDGPFVHFHMSHLIHPETFRIRTLRGDLGNHVHTVEKGWEKLPA